ncbi:MAG: hypothetical protein EOP48_22720 [Sphingobacteriales bacterium]|nr:MAG: hypothetical protein EOP48_22720 [Sphingobacteriales bacterium]
MHSLKNKHVFLIYGLVVLLPLIMVAIYLYTAAQDRYISSSTMVVKQVGQVGIEQSTGLGALLGVNNTSGEDAQFLKAYMQSSDMVYALDSKLNLRDAFAGNGNDVVFQLPKNASKEELVVHFNKRVRVALDEKTMMMTLVL